MAFPSTTLSATPTSSFEPLFSELGDACRGLGATDQRSCAQALSLIHAALCVEGATFTDACRGVPMRDGCLILQLLQQIMDKTAPTMLAHAYRNDVFHLQNALSGHCGMLVGIRVISVPEGEQLGNGGFGEIWKAVYQGQAVAIKKLRFYEKSAEAKNGATLRMLRREILMWRQLNHPYILPLMGITSHLLSKAGMVAAWQEHGNMMDYAKTNPDANRLLLLEKVGHGLQYLHTHIPVMIHADLKCANVLIGSDGSPLLTDFGLTTVRHGATLTSAVEGGSRRWQAAELLQCESDSASEDENVEDNKVTRYSDIWSFGMTVLELMTEMWPFSDKVNNAMVVLALSQNERPKRPGHEARARGLDNELWKCLWGCWNARPDKRPSLQEIIRILHALAENWSPLSSATSSAPITVDMEVPQEICGRIIGRDGTNARRLEEDLRVKLQISSSGESGALSVIKICGRTKDVEDAKWTLSELVNEHSNAVERSVSIPSHAHGYLIGSRGSHIRRLEDIHSVKVTFVGDTAVVKGPEKSVDNMVKELTQKLDRKQLWNPQQSLRVGPRLAQRLRNEQDTFTASTGLDSVHVVSPQAGDEFAVIEMRGSDAAQTSAMQQIWALRAQIEQEVSQKIRPSRNPEEADITRYS